MNYDVNFRENIEKRIIGILLTPDQPSFKDLLIKHSLKETDFSNKICGKIYTIFIKAINENLKPDAIFVTKELRKWYEDSYNFIIDLILRAPAHYYLERDLFLLKEYVIKDYWRSIYSKILNSDFENIDILEFSDSIFDSYKELNNRIVNPLVANEENDLMKSFIEKRENFQKGITKSLKFDVETLNQMYDGGLYPGEFYVWAGRPGMGKTTFLLIVSWLIYKRYQTPVLFFSLEMPKEQLVNKIISLESGIDYKKIKKGDLTDSEFNIVLNYLKMIENSDFLIYDKIFYLDAIERKCEEMFSKHGKIGLIQIDYIQLVKVRNTTIRETVVETTRTFKNLAKIYSCPLIGLSQLSRSVEIRGGNKIPLLSDLKESGSVEEDADVVMFFHRLAYYFNEYANNHDNLFCTGCILAKGRDMELQTKKLVVSPIVYKIYDYEHYDISIY